MTIFADLSRLVKDGTTSNILCCLLKGILSRYNGHPRAFRSRIFLCHKKWPSKQISFLGDNTILDGTLTQLDEEKELLS